MKKEIEVSAKTKEEAIAKAVEELGAPSESALFITVISEGRKGFLGFGSVDATIKAIYQIPDTPKEDGDRPARRDRGDRRDRNRGRGRGGRGPREPRAEEPAVEIEMPTRAPVTPIDPATATESEQTAYRFIVELVKNMGLAEAVVTMHPGDNDDMVIAVEGDTAGVLIGHHGDTLDAVQYLANLAANRKEEGEKREYARITVDVESYRAKREMALRVLARKKAAQVLRNKKSLILEPMSPYERRIIHSEIQKVEGVATNSIGADNNRRVVIYLEEEGMPTTGLPTTAPKSNGSRSGEKSGRSRNRRRRSKSNDTVDPFATASKREPVPSVFSDDDEHDPFDIDLSAATYQGEDEEE